LEKIVCAQREKTGRVSAITKKSDKKCSDMRPLRM